MDFILGLLGNMELAPKIAVIVIGVNLLLSSVVNVLDFIKEKTKWEGDNKAAASLHKVLDFLKKIVDWASANQKH